MAPYPNSPNLFLDITVPSKSDQPASKIILWPRKNLTIGTKIWLGDMIIKISSREYCFLKNKISFMSLDEVVFKNATGNPVSFMPLKKVQLLEYPHSPIVINKICFLIKSPWLLVFLSDNTG